LILMKKILLFVSLFISIKGFSQCNPIIIPASARVVTSDSIITSFTPEDTIVICNGKTLTYDYMNSNQVYFYIDANAKLILKSIQISHIYISAGATLHIDTNGSAFNFVFANTIYFDSTNVNLIDTAEADNLFNWVHCPGAAINFTQFPGAISPCSPATQINNIDKLDDNIQLYPNPVNSNLFVESLFLNNYNWSISTIFGQKINTDPKYLSQNKISFDISNFKNGIYILNSLDKSNSRIINRKIFVKE
ncbi:MAG: T9SS type A sorting domain-containing protein, partial [Chitinophagaceae bacterium]|nr:T9SS type A sorting domain-containing protein [Chitinophagaceae bacterium]